MKWSRLIAAVSVISFWLSGCAAGNKPLSREALQPVSSMTVAHLKTPSLLKETTGSKAAGAVGAMFGAIGGGIGGAIKAKMMASNGNEVQQRCNLPDYGQRVFDQLTARLPKEVTGWPKTVVKSEPVSDEAEVSDGYAMIVKVNFVKIENGKGLSAVTSAQLRDPKGTVMWQKKIEYETKEYNRQCDLDVLEADKGKLLHDEYEFAVEKTVSTLIKDLNGG